MRHPHFALPAFAVALATTLLTPAPGSTRLEDEAFVPPLAVITVEGGSVPTPMPYRYYDLYAGGHVDLLAPGAVFVRGSGRTYIVFGGVVVAELAKEVR